MFPPFRTLLSGGRLAIVAGTIATATFAHAAELALLPQPIRAEARAEAFEIGESTRIVTTAANLQPVADYLSARLAGPLGRKISVVHSADKTPPTSAISFNELPSSDSLDREGYRLEVTSNKVAIYAPTPAGAFYAVQTLLQLMSPEVARSQPAANVTTWKIAGAVITDQPQFPWRGLMLDVSRHFFDREFIKSYLDQMAAMKLNIFHWHLTDDQGWRLPISGYPKLTHGDSYSVADIKEIVAYAAARHITIVPEIDVPGHNLAATTAYPSLACTGRPEKALCAGNEEVFVFLEKVMGEVAELFPGEYVHVGGDEVEHKLWRACPKCQARLQHEKLRDEDELQSYFMRRVAKFAAQHGKKVIGWDEILEGGAPKDTTIMSWRGEYAGIEAARRGHPVIMTPMWPCYLDFGQGDRVVEPKSFGDGKFVTLREAFAFEPVPAGADAKLVLGGQGNLWTEMVAHPRHVEYMTWPRGAALAEALWSGRNRPAWDDFSRRLEVQFARWKAADVNFALSALLPIACLEDTAEGPRIALPVEIEGTELYYTFDGSNPDRHYPKYTTPLAVPAGATSLRVAAYRQGQRIGDQLNVTLAELQLRRDQLRAEREWQQKDARRVMEKYRNLPP